MPKEKTPEEVYDELVTGGLYEEANLDGDEIGKVLKLAAEDYGFGKELRKISNANWRVIFNINYDVLRELCDQMMRFKKQKISNHQGLFAFVMLKFPELELDWKFFETIRNVRNQNKYKGADITRDMWKKVEFQMDLYISTLKKEIERRLKIV
ncbi:hypothetical protein COV19_06275 [Candidatus Woesearchaeota archaeon CG10_big_fil_rev_8_21_14_0_10_44_13]|nr:MAG: hypothetical protein COV19_06275 [Candidatus Woesearchaeota archaeon CG10_big_fil_rev_8_21_14_0_10_44_13]